MQEGAFSLQRALPADTRVVCLDLEAFSSQKLAEGTAASDDRQAFLFLYSVIILSLVEGMVDLADVPLFTVEILSQHSS